MSDCLARPVVIQTMWRTGGTYLAFTLRDQNPVALFYEPLHEDYSSRTQSDWEAFAQAGAASSLGHPTKSFHYLTDYPFLPGAGVVGHRPDFAFQRFALGADDEAPELRAYLDGLVNHAAAQGRRPLFKFCRGFLRQGWIARALDPVTIYLTRSPAGMAHSHARNRGGKYFYSGYLRILSSNRGERRLAHLFERVASAHPDYAAASPSLLAGEDLALTVPHETRLDLFLYFWALALAANVGLNVLTLDAAALGADPSASAEALRRHTGLAVDLADAVPLDQGGDLLRFRDAAFGDILREALGSRPDLSGVADETARQFEALLAG